MRPSPLRTTVAVLRTTIGLGQKGFAELIERSTSTVQALELGKLPLSEKLAVIISEKTGVSAHWLLAGDPLAPPQTQQQEPLDQWNFNMWRSFASRSPTLTPESAAAFRLIAEDYGAKVVAILCEAHRRGWARGGVALFHTEKFIKQLQDECCDDSHKEERPVERGTHPQQTAIQSVAACPLP